MIWKNYKFINCTTKQQQIQQIINFWRHEDEKQKLVRIIFYSEFCIIWLFLFSFLAIWLTDLIRKNY